MLRAWASALAASSAVVAVGGAARAQAGASPGGGSVQLAPPPRLVPSTGTVAPGVYRAAQPGATAVRFRLRGAGQEPIGVGAAYEDGRALRFAPACATPCTLWFEPGAHTVQLGHSPLRTRSFAMTVGEAPVEVSFSRDSTAGVVAGVFVAGLGVVTMLVAVPLALTDAARPGLWWAAAGGGALVLGGGVALTVACLGSADVLPVAPGAVARLRF